MAQRLCQGQGTQCGRIWKGFVQKYPIWFLFNFISIFETINKNTFFVNNLFIIVYQLLIIT